MEPDGIVTRGRLPHWYMPGYAHFITYRLAGTIPAVKLREWRERRELGLKQKVPEGMTAREHRARIHKQFFQEYDRYLDNNRERQWLAKPDVAAMIRENLYHHDGGKYQLLAWCIMPNHVHVVLQPLEIVGQAASSPGPAPAKLAASPTLSKLPACSAKLAGSATGTGTFEDELFSDDVSDQASPLESIMHSLKSYTANRANEILGRSGQFWQHESYDHWVRDLDELERIVSYIRGNPVAAGLCEQPIQWKFSSAYDRFQRDGSLSALVGWLRDDWRK